MTTKAILFDLDGTLVDTSNIYDLRRARRWKDCVAKLHQTQLYDGIGPLLQALRKAGIKTAVVTTSVSFYAEKVCAHHGMRYDTLVAYHDAKPKPAPDAFRLAMERLGVDRTETIGVGDDLPDSLGLHAAKIQSLGAGWNKSINPEAEWDDVLHRPGDLLALIGK